MNLTPWREKLTKALVNGLPDLSLRNCHHLGLDSIAVSLHDFGTHREFVRMFVAWSDCHTLDTLHRPDGHFNIGVHNHKYDLQMEVISGTVINHEVVLQDDNDHGPALYEHVFESGVTGKMKLGVPRKRHVHSFSNVHLTAGSGLFRRWLDSTDLHTVIVPKKGDYTAWLITEHGTADHDSLFYSPIPQPYIDSQNLYQPFNVTDAERVLEYVLEETKWTNQPKTICY